MRDTPLSSVLLRPVVSNLRRLGTAGEVFGDHEAARDIWIADVTFEERCYLDIMFLEAPEGAALAGHDADRNEVREFRRAQADLLDALEAATARRAAAVGPLAAIFSGMDIAGLLAVVKAFCVARGTLQAHEELDPTPLA